MFGLFQGSNLHCLALEYSAPPLIVFNMHFSSALPFVACMTTFLTLIIPVKAEPEPQQSVIQSEKSACFSSSGTTECWSLGGDKTWTSELAPSKTETPAIITAATDPVVRPVKCFTTDGSTECYTFGMDRTWHAQETATSLHPHPVSRPVICSPGSVSCHTIDPGDITFSANPFPTTATVPRNSDHPLANPVTCIDNTDCWTFDPAQKTWSSQDASSAPASASTASTATTSPHSKPPAEDLQLCNANGCWTVGGGSASARPPNEKEDSAGLPAHKQEL